MSKKSQQLRIEGFTDDLEERKFESLLDKNEGVRRGPFGSALKKDLFVKESPYVVYEQQNAIYDHYETRYNISKEKFEELHKFELIADDFIMSGAGTIGRISKVPKGIKKGVFNQALIRFRINKELTDSEYFLQFIRADFMQRKLTGANPGSAITNLVPMSDVKKWEIKVPIKEEQKKIGSFFKQLDDTIALHQRKLDLLKEQKKGYLQKMFPKNGAKVPELRFAGFADDWELRKVGELLTERNEQAPMNDEFPLMAFIANEGVAPKGERYDRSSLVNDTAGKLYKKTRFGDFIYSSNNLETGSIGLNKYGNASVSPVYSIFEATGIADSDFIGRRLVRKDFINAMIKWRQGVVYGQWKIHESDFVKIEVAVPSVDEQRQIGEFLDTLDQQITLHQRKLEKLKNLKKALLNELFV